MLAFLFNFGFLEIGVILVVAVLVFGRRLPEVAGQAAAQVYRARRALADLRRESGIDEELRKARRTFDAADQALRKHPTPKPAWYPKTDPESVARSGATPSEPAAGLSGGALPAPAGPIDPPPGSSGPAAAPTPTPAHEAEDAAGGAADPGVGEDGEDETGRS